MSRYHVLVSLPVHTSVSIHQVKHPAVQRVICSKSWRQNTEYSKDGEREMPWYNTTPKDIKHEMALACNRSTLPFASRRGRGLIAAYPTPNLAHTAGTGAIVYHMVRTVATSTTLQNKQELHYKILDSYGWSAPGKQNNNQLWRTHHIANVDVPQPGAVLRKRTKHIKGGVRVACGACALVFVPYSTFLAAVSHVSL